MRLPRALISSVVVCFTLQAQTLPQSRDTDRDGLSDALEQRLLEQFTPAFLTSPADCSRKPAAFAPGVLAPTVQSEDGTIYGQATPLPARVGAEGTPEIELHFFHLWQKDCGPHSHPLDAEHVAALLRRTGTDGSDAKWTAVYWYAAAHEQTVCDVSQIARAVTLHAEQKGPRVWISPGKHASYFGPELCRSGCGADLCEHMEPLAISRVVNLGEVGRPMNGSQFLASGEWAMAAKMQETNFPAEPIARLERLPASEIAWFHPGRHPVQGVIAISSSTGNAIGKGGAETAASMDLAEDSAGDALSTAAGSTGDALGTSYRSTRKALVRSAHGVRRAMRATAGIAP